MAVSKAMTTKSKVSKTLSTKAKATKKTTVSAKTASRVSAPAGSQKAGTKKDTSTAKRAKANATGIAIATVTRELSTKASATGAKKAAGAKPKSASKAAPRKTPAGKSTKSKSTRSVTVSAPRRPQTKPATAPFSLAAEIAEAMMVEMGGGEDAMVERQAARNAKEQDVLGRLAVSMNRYDDMPNQELAANIVFHLDHEAVGILVAAIERGDDVHAPDAARVLCEVGARDSELLEPVAERLVAVFDDGESPMLPLAMYALSPVCHHVVDQLWDMRELFWSMLSSPSGHTEMAQTGGVKLLAALCAASPEYARTLAGGLVDLLGKCLPKDVALFAESVLPALGPAHAHRAKPVLDRRMKELTPAEVARLRRAVRGAQTSSGYSAAA